MLATEQRVVTPHAHSNSIHEDLPMDNRKSIPLRLPTHAELGDLEREHGVNPEGNSSNSAPPVQAAIEAQSPRERAFALTFGLVIHDMADGLVLSVSFLTRSQTGAATNVSSFSWR